MTGGEVVAIGRRETLLQFIERQGTVSTVGVAYRFGWPVGKARAELKSLLAAGLLTEKLVSNNETGAPTLDWELKK